MAKDSVWTMSHQLLSDYWQQTGIRRLTGAKCREFLGAEGLIVTSCRKLALRAIYRSILNECGLEYEGQYYSWLQNITILWVAIIWQAEKLGLVSGPNDGLYTLEEDGLNWSGVSDIAQDITLVHLRDMCSKEGCLNLFLGRKSRTVGGQRFRQQILYQCNWDRLKGNSLSHPPSWRCNV